jgi:hypothetical protein
MEEEKPQDLLKKIAELLSRDDQDVSIEASEGTEGVTLVNITRRPSGEPTWFTAEDGTTIFDWRDKFDRQKRGMHPPFQFGEKVLVSGFVEPDPDSLYKIHVDADGRLADNFYLATVPQPDPLRDFVGMPLEVIIDIVDERKSEWQISNIQNYDARLLEVVSKPIVNPSRADLEKLQSGKRVVVKGKFLGFGNNETYGEIETEDGRKIRINMPTGKVAFSGGVLECLTLGASSGRDRKLPEDGDHLTIGAFVSRDRQLGVHWCDPCLLTKPSPQREQRYNALRQAVDLQINQIKASISESEYSEARKLIGDSRALELTSSELEKLRGLTQDIPESERPVQTPKDEHNRDGRRHFFVESIDEAYQTRLESMTREEFVRFANSAVKGDRKQTGRKADTSYLFAIAQDFGIDPNTQEELVVSCLESRLGRIRGKPYNHDRDWDDKYNSEQALKYLAGIGAESSATRLFGYLRSFVERKDFHQIGWRNHRDERPETFVFPAVLAISTHIEEMPREVVRREIPYLESLRDYLSGSADEPITVEVLDKTFSHFKKLEAGSQE